MPDFRRTLPMPPPGRTVGEAVEESMRRHSRKPAVPPAERGKSMVPGRATPGPGERGKSMLPGRATPGLPTPPREFRRSRPGRKTPQPGGSEGRSVLPDHATASWALKARTLSSALDEALRSGQASPKTRACIERAYAAWTLDGVPTQTLARVAHLTRRAHDAIRESSRGGLENAYADCARVLHLGLPSAVRKRVPLETAVDVVRGLRREADSWVAVVEATMVLVGWTDGARARAAEAIRTALEECPPESTRDGD
jgi:hypothetical protein